MMGRAALVGLIILLFASPLAPAGADYGEPPRHVVEEDGHLLVGTYPLRIGKVDGGEHAPDLGLDPVSSHAVTFTTTPCFVALEVALHYTSLLGDGATGQEEAWLGVRVADGNGTTRANWLATGGTLHRAVDDPPLATNASYTVEVYHMLGPRVAYHLDGWLHHGCID